MADITEQGAKFGDSDNTLLLKIAHATQRIADNGAAPSGPAGGDLEGTYPDPTVKAARFSVPGPIGNTTPSTLAGTTLTLTDTTEQVQIRYDASNRYDMTVGSTGVINNDAIGTDPRWEWYLNGTRYAFLNASAFALTNGAGVAITGAYAAATSRVSGPSGVDGIGFPQEGQVQIVGGFRTSRTATATDYVVLMTDSVIGVTDTSLARIVTLPSAVTAGSGAHFTVKDESGAAGTNNITVKSAAGTIDGVAAATGVAINTNYGALDFYSNGANWFIY